MPHLNLFSLICLPIVLALKTTVATDDDKFISHPEKSRTNFENIFVNSQN